MTGCLLHKIFENTKKNIQTIGYYYHNNAPCISRMQISTLYRIL